MKLAECIVYADIVIDGSKESVNYVYCAMHYNTFSTVETSSKLQKAAKKTYQPFVFCCFVICAHKLKISKKLAKLLEKSKVNKFKYFKCLLVRVACPKNSNILFYSHIYIRRHSQ